MSLEETNPELAAIAYAWDKETGDGRDEGARLMADDYVAAHPEEFLMFEGMPLPDLVELLSTYRRSGMEEAQWRAEVWQLHHWEPQNIGGEYHATLRKVN